MTIYRKFKHTTLTLFCLATVLPTLANAAMQQVNMSGLEPDIQIQSLLLQGNGGNGGVDSLDGNLPAEDLNEGQLQIALASVDTDALAESVSFSAFNVSTRSLSPSSQLAQMKVAATAGIATQAAPVPINLNDPAALGNVVFKSPSSQQMQARIAAMVAQENLGLMAKQLPLSTTQLATGNGPVVLQLASGSQVNRANIAAALIRAQLVMELAKTATVSPSGLGVSGIALDEQISQSSPKGLVIADQALDADGKFTPQAAKLFGAVKSQPGDSYIMMGSPAVTAEMAKALASAGVKPSQMRAVNLTQTQGAPTQFSGLNAQLSGMKGADTAGAGKQVPGMVAANEIAILQVAHRFSPQDFMTQTPGNATTQASLNNS